MLSALKTRCSMCVEFVYRCSYDNANCVMSTAGTSVYAVPRFILLLNAVYATSGGTRSRRLE